MLNLVVCGPVHMGKEGNGIKYCVKVKFTEGVPETHRNTLSGKLKVILTFQIRLDNPKLQSKYKSLLEGTRCRLGGWRVKISM